MPNGGSLDITEILKKKQPISDKEYRTLSRIMAANLRTPLTGLMGYLAMLSQGDFGKLEPKHKKIIDDLLAESQRIIRFVNGMIELGKLQKGVTPPHADEITKTYKILHFEDERMLRGMYEVKFQMRGFDFSGYDSPTKDPVSLVLKEKPDLIIMDIIMPISDGFTATRQLKADGRTKDIPILGLCNLGQKEDIENAHKVGMADYLVSANHMPNEVIKRVCEIIGIPMPKEKSLPPVETKELNTKKSQKRSWWQWI